MKRGLTAIIVAHNSNDYLPVCLSSIYRSAGELDIQVLVVDNASDITPSSLFRDDFPKAEWIESDKNLGFGKACNLGVESAHHNNLFFINPDTYISTTTFSKLLDFIKIEENPGIVGCKILNGDGSLQAACRRNFPSPSGALFHTIGLDKIFPNSELFGQYNLTFKSEDEIHELDAVSGSFFWINKDVYKEIEGFDEDFFLYGEDLDLCYRVQKTGRKNIYYPHARVMHFKGHSSDQKPWRTSVHFYNAMRIFAQKHKSLTNLPYFIVELGIIFSAIIGSFVRIANSPKSFIKDGLIVALVLVLTLSFGVFEPVGAISWLGPALGIWFTSSFFSGEFRGKGKWDKIEIFKKTDFVFGAITDWLFS